MKSNNHMLVVLFFAVAFLSLTLSSCNLFNKKTGQWGVSIVVHNSNGTAAQGKRVTLTGLNPEGCFTATSKNTGSTGAVSFTGSNTCPCTDFTWAVSCGATGPTGTVKPTDGPVAVTCN